MNQNNGNQETYILFEVAGTTYGVNSQTVQQIQMVEHITPLPNAPAFIEGVAFTRGQVVPAVNLRTRFGFEKTPHNTRSRLIVTNNNGRSIGLIVDSAREFMSITADSIQPPPDTIAGLSGKYVKGIVMLGDRIVIVLDLNQLVSVTNTRTTTVEA